MVAENVEMLEQSWKPVGRRGMKILGVYRTTAPINVDNSRVENPDGTKVIQWIGAKGKQGRNLYYNVKWQGWPYEFNTWETERKIPQDVLQALPPLQTVV